MAGKRREEDFYFKKKDGWQFVDQVNNLISHKIPFFRAKKIWNSDFYRQSNPLR